MRKAIGRVNNIKAFHDAVTSYLGDNGSSSNRSAQRITMHYGFNLHIGNLHRHSINQRCLRTAVQVFQHLRHALLRCGIDIKRVNIVDADDVHFDIQRLSHNFVIQHIALRSGKLLGIVQPADKHILGQNNGSYNQRSCQRSASRFIYAGNQLAAFSIQLAFQFQHPREALLLRRRLLQTLVVCGQKLLYSLTFVCCQRRQLVRSRLACQQLLDFSNIHYNPP